MLGVSVLREFVDSEVRLGKISTPVAPISSDGFGNVLGRREVYLDYAAATPMDPRVVAATMPYLSERFENPSAPYARSRAVRVDLEAARAQLAHLIGGRPAQVTLTAGATEANNLALASVDGPVVTDAAEHDSVLACVEARGGTVVGVGPDGRVDARAMASAITPTTQLVSLELANGEVGAVQPVRELARAVATERVRRLEAGDATPLLLHTDASQAAESLSVNVSSLGADLVTLSAAKVYGPKQVGLLWASDRVRLRPLVLGGGQEGGVRSGTENVAGAVAFAEALRIAVEGRAAEAKRLEALRKRMCALLADAVPWMAVFGPPRPKLRLPGLLAVSFPGLEARRLVVLLEREGVSVGTGSACAASRMESSHVLAAMGVSPEVASGSLRLSLGRPTTQDDVDYAAAAIAYAVRSECGRVGLDPATGLAFAHRAGEVPARTHMAAGGATVAEGGRP